MKPFKSFCPLNLGDLVQWRHWHALVIKKDEWVTLVRWLHDDSVEAAESYNYGEINEWKVISRAAR